jgi:Protein of unknown function with HXXEE motif
VTVRKLVLFAPFIFAMHVLEEAPGFVAWFNSLVPRGITQQMFLGVNTVAFVITVLIAALVAASADPVAGLTLAAWIGFLFLANGLFHIVATIAHGRYCPGVITGALLYLPYGAILLRGIVRDLRVPAAAVAGAAVVGAVPMLAHGYLIVFRGSRLF